MRSLTLLCLLLAPAIAVYIDSFSYSHFLSLGPVPCLLFVLVPWCDHCRALYPELRYLAATFATNPDLLIARLNADDEPDVAARLRVNSYPTILFFNAGVDVTDKSETGIEFADWRWAEVMIQFVNNHTHTPIHLKPRQQFLDWRKNNPFNIFSAPSKAPLEEVVDQSGVFDDGISRLPIREPTEITPHIFPRLFHSTHRYMLLVFSSSDPLIDQTIVQWRQASSAFSEAENTTVAFLRLPQHKQLAQQLHVASTPACVYIGLCQNCLKRCDDEMYHTENIIAFLSDMLMEELGVKEEKASNTYHLTVEQYEQLKADGKLFANEPQHGEKIRQVYEQVRLQVEQVKEDL